MPVGTRILPKPAIGETMLPDRNPEAPSIADAVPACFLAELSAKDIVTGKVAPIIAHKTSSDDSNKIIDKLFDSTNKRKTLQIIMPELLIIKDLSWFLNLADIAAPAPRAIAFTAKNRLNSNGVK
jgi:hypothetical protein